MWHGMDMRRGGVGGGKVWLAHHCSQEVLFSKNLDQKINVIMYSIYVGVRKLSVRLAYSQYVTI